VIGTFTSSDPDYTGGTVTGTLIIDKATTPSPWLSCPGPLTYDAQPHTCVVIGGINCTTNSVTNVPGGPITATCVGDANHVPWSGSGWITITPATPTATVNCPTAIVYDGNPHMCSVNITGIGGVIVPGSLTCSPGAWPVNAGNYTMICIFHSADPNYTDITVRIPIIINPFPPVPGPVPPCMFPADGKPHICILPLPIGIGGSPVNGTWTCSPGPQFAVGNYPETCSFASADPNYGSASMTTTLTIQQTTPISCSTLPATVTYGAAPIPFACSTSTPKATLKYTVTGPATLSNGALTIKGAGTVTVLVTQAAITGTPAAYWPASGTAASITVSQAPLTITFGTSEPKFTYSVSGLVNSDKAPSMHPATTATAVSDLGDYPITLASPAMPNYAITINPATLHYVINSAAVLKSPTAPSIGFKNVAVGQASKPVAVKLTNKTGAHITFTASVSSSDFTVTPATCQVYRSPSNICSFAVSFTPQSGQAISGTITFTPTDDNADPGANALAPVVWDLSGYGVGPIGVDQPIFLPVSIGQSSTKSVTVSNQTGWPLSLVTASVTGNKAFTVLSNGCAGATIPVGGTCTIWLKFAPTASTLPPFAATLSISGTATTPAGAFKIGPITIPLTGATQ
jgi:hypothetical protein